MARTAGPWSATSGTHAAARRIRRPRDAHLLPHISFDNDLRQPLEGWEGLRDIVERRLDDPSFLPALTHVALHSLNGGAVDRMESRARGAVDAGV